MHYMSLPYRSSDLHYQKYTVSSENKYCMHEDLVDATTHLGQLSSLCVHFAAQTFKIDLHELTTTDRVFYDLVVLRRPSPGVFDHRT